MERRRADRGAPRGSRREEWGEDSEDESDELRKSRKKGESEDEEDRAHVIGRHASDGSRHTRFFSVRSGLVRSHQSGR